MHILIATELLEATINNCPQSDVPLMSILLVDTSRRSNVIDLLCCIDYYQASKNMKMIMK